MPPRPLRVAMLAPHFAEYALRLSCALAKNCQVLLIADADNLANECKPQWVADARSKLRLVAYRYAGKASRLGWLARIVVQTALFRPDIIHVQEQADASTARIVRLLKPLAPVVLTVHDPKPHTGTDAAIAAARDGHRQALRRAAGLHHVHGDFCRRQLLDVCSDRRPVVRTDHGVILVPDAGERREPVPGRLLFFGRMEAYKGLETLLDASDLLVRRGVDHSLVLAGRGPELERLKPRIDAASQVGVVAKFLTPAEAIAQFQDAVAVVAAYTDATQSGVVAAAYGAGRPIIASPVGGLADSVIDGVSGLFTPPGDGPALAEAMRKMLHDAALQQKLRSGVVQVGAERFGWAPIAAALTSAYRTLLDEKPGR